MAGLPHARPHGEVSGALALTLNLTVCSWSCRPAGAWRGEALVGSGHCCNPRHHVSPEHRYGMPAPCPYRSPCTLARMHWKGRGPGGGCQSGWGLLAVTKAVEVGTWRQGDSGWASAGRPGGGGGGGLPPNASLPRPPDPDQTPRARIQDSATEEAPPSTILSTAVKDAKAPPDWLGPLAARRRGRRAMSMNSTSDLAGNQPPTGDGSRPTPPQTPRPVIRAHPHVDAPQAMPPQPMPVHPPSRRRRHSHAELSNSPEPP